MFWLVNHFMLWFSRTEPCDFLSIWLQEQWAKQMENVKPGLGNKYAKERALKQLQKNAKGNLEVIEVSISCLQHTNHTPYPTSLRINNKNNKAKACLHLCLTASAFAVVFVVSGIFSMLYPCVRCRARKERKNWHHPKISSAVCRKKWPPRSERKRLLPRARPKSEQFPLTNSCCESLNFFSCYEWRHKCFFLFFFVLFFGECVFYDWRRKIICEGIGNLWWNDANKQNSNGS